jgi:ABC-type proline/glycine betaine transport system permease subunit
MFICIFIAAFINIDIQSNTMPIFALLATLLDIVLGYWSHAINNSGLIFILANSLLSILMGLAAWIISRSIPKPTTLNNLKFAQAKK